jgi:hypothetical protein
MLMATGYTYKVSMQMHGKSYFGEAGVNVVLQQLLRTQVTDVSSELKLVRIRSIFEWVR